MLLEDTCTNRERRNDTEMTTTTTTKRVKIMMTVDNDRRASMKNRYTRYPPRALLYNNMCNNVWSC